MKKYFLLTLLFAAILLLPAKVEASIVRLDETFGGIGYVTHHDAGGGDNADYGYGIIEDASGKYVVVGRSNKAGGNSVMVVWRFNLDGSLDVTFNGTGYMTHSGAAGGDDDIGYDIVQLSSGKYLVCGQSEDASGEEDLALWRINQNGSLDLSFNSTGYVTHNDAAGGDGIDSCSALAVQDDGKIVVAGTSDNSLLSYNFDMVVWRFEANGSLDATFGDPAHPCSNGVGVGSNYGCIVHNGAAGGNGDDQARGVQIDSQGKIVVAGYSLNALSRNEMAIWRLTSSGVLDSAFDSTGYASHGIAANYGTLGYSLAIDDENRYIVVGGTMPVLFNYDIMIWRYTNQGILDNSFNGSGYVEKDYGESGSTDDMSAVQIDDHGRYVVAGRRVTPGNSDLAIWRYLEDGNVDTTFNGVGYIFQDNLDQRSDFGQGLVLTEGGKYVTVGDIDNLATSYDLAVWRFENLYQIENFDSGLTAEVNEVSIESDTGNGVYGGYEITVEKEGTLIAKILTDMVEDRDWSDVTGGVDLENFKSFMHNLTNAPGTADTYTLYVPRKEGDAGVGICPGADQLSMVNDQCDNVYYLSAEDGNVSLKSVAGIDYWVVSGLTGTGGFSAAELPSTGSQIFILQYITLLCLGLFTFRKLRLRKN